MLSAGWFVLDRLKIKFSSHFNKGTCHPVQRCSLYFMDNNEAPRHWRIKLHQALATQIALVSRIYSVLVLVVSKDLSTVRECHQPYPTGLVIQKMPVFCINSQEYTVTVITVCMQFNPEGALWQLLPSYPLNTKNTQFYWIKWTYCSPFPVWNTWKPQSV